METFSLKVKHVNLYLENNHGHSLTKPETLSFGHTFESNFLLATTRATHLSNGLVL